MGIEVTRSKEGTFISQRKYLKEESLLGVKQAKTPLVIIIASICTRLNLSLIQDHFKC